MASGAYSFLAGLDYSQFGSYNASLIAAAAMGALSCAGCLFIRPSEQPTPTTVGAALAA